MTAGKGKSSARQVAVDAESADRRLDNFLLTELKGLPRSRIYSMIRKGEVRVNKGRSRAAYKVQEGDIVRIPPVARAVNSGVSVANPAKAGWILERIIYEDEQLLAIDKPAGLAVHGGSGISLGAIELLRSARPEAPYLELVHRLDRATSGVLMLAKKRSALRRLHAAFRDGEADKNYQALLLGQWQGGERTVDLPLVVEHRQNGERHVRVGDDGKPAASVFTPQESFAGTTLVNVRLLTGRTHQIRVHAAASGHPVAGDARYGDAEGDPPGLKRLFLHAASLELAHPTTGESLRLTAPLDNELEKILLAQAGS